MSWARLIAFGAAAGFVFGATSGLSALGLSRLAPPRTDAAEAQAEMAAIERLLVFHGFPVEGFAAGAAPDLAVIDALAPAGCAGVMRASVLARLALARHAPAFEGAAGDVAAAAAAAADRASGAGCLPVRPPMLGTR
jgi:hypothetical protein